MAEALNSAARRARQGQALSEALSGASGYTRIERLAVDRLAAVGLESVLGALEELAALDGFTLDLAKTVLERLNAPRET